MCGSRGKRANDGSVGFRVVFCALCLQNVAEAFLLVWFTVDVKLLHIHHRSRQFTDLVCNIFCFNSEGSHSICAQQMINIVYVFNFSYLWINFKNAC